MLIDMVRNNKFQFAASKKEIQSMKVEKGDVLMLDIKNYDDYYDTHPIELFIDGLGDRTMNLKSLVFAVTSIVELPMSEDVIVNMEITSDLGISIPEVPEMKKSAGLPTDYL